MCISVKGRLIGTIVVGLVLAIVPGLRLMASQTQTKTISTVEVESEDSRTRVILRGAEDVMYTAFLREDPPQLIIDLPEVVFDGVETPISVGDGRVTDIVLGEFGDPKAPSTSRVSIGLTESSEYEVVPRGNELVISLQGAAAVSAVRAPDAERETDAGDVQLREEPEVELRQAEQTAPEPIAADPIAEAPASEPRPAQAVAGLSRIIEVKAVADSVEVHADGPIDNVDSFVLEDPDRIVIDFWGARSGIWPATRNLDGGAVAKVRVGEHPDKVRVVLDLRAAPSTHVVSPIRNGVRVEIESTQSASWSEGVAMDDTVPAAPADEALEGETMEPGDDEATGDLPVEPDVDAEVSGQPEDSLEPDTDGDADSDVDVDTEPAPQASWSPSEGGELAVSSVHFESMPTLDRIVVSLTRRGTATLAQPDVNTVIVDLPGVKIRSSEERRVDTREFQGPIEIFSAFRSPEIEGDNVRVVMKRRGNEQPTISWEGSQLRIEVPRPAGMAAASPQAGPDASAPMSPSAAPAAMPQGDLAQAHGNIPASLPGSRVPAAIPAAGEDQYAGPAAPDAIDVLEEGGFSRDKLYQGRRVSLDFKDADLGNILRLIAEVSDLNVIAGEEVGGNVTIRMVDVPWDQALDVVLMTKGLGFMRIGNILRIAPIDVLQREEESRLQERRAKEKLEDLVVKLQPVNYANVGEVADLVKRLLSPRGTVNVDSRTSTLIIKDIPTVIQEATALVKAIDTATPQVLIEAKIVEASLDFSRSLGARWGVGYNALGSNGGGQDLHLGDGSNSVIPGFGSGTQGSNFVVANPIAAAVGTLTLGLLGLDDHIQLDLQLQAAESRNKGKVISSPRVVTLDNREAVIQQGVAIAFTAEDGDSINTSFVDAVLELKVKPHITADKSIIMDIKVSRNAPQLSDADGTVVGIAKNETKTEALVRDGQTMVLGGIYTVDKGRGRSKMPFLADIPVLGVAFRNSTQTDIRRELLVFVTPRIVQGHLGGN